MTYEQAINKVSDIRDEIENILTDGVVLESEDRKVLLKAYKVIESIFDN